MSFDLSRKTFNPLQDYLGVVMQQGRVQLDADWNVSGAQFSRRIQAGTLDTFGPAVVPRVTPTGFEITGNPANINIGAGRIYVDGILAENHLRDLVWNASLAELAGQDPVAYSDPNPDNQQPYYPNPPALPAQENYLVYVDVWHRDITHLHDPDLVEKALGVDTTGRLQTVWQVKALGGIGTTDATTADEDIPGWLETIHPSSARLSTSTGDLDDDPNPCQLPPQAGYKGLENQLYRIEIHRGTGAEPATFKWSRENATVTTRVSAIPSATELVVESLGRDDKLRFNEGDWVEVTDEQRVLHGVPGVLRRIQVGGGIDEATRTISLEGADLPRESNPQVPPPGEQFYGFADGVDGQLTPARKTIVKRWDQGGSIRREDGSEYANLDLAGSPGDIEIPPAGTRLFLEQGILVEFELAPTNQPFAPEYRSADYWLVAARASDASIEILDRAPPLGIHHHYAKLALVFPNEIIDCRTFWPPDPGGEGCACTVCVDAEGHNSGQATIQQAVDTVIAAGGGSVCLAIGQYQINAPIRISGNSISLKGQGWQTMLIAREPIDLIQVGNEGLSTDISLSNFLGVTTIAEGFGTVVAVQNVFGFRMEHCFLANGAVGEGTSQGLRLTGLVALADVVDCEFIAERGIAGPVGDNTFLGTFDLSIAQCEIAAPQRGIDFSGISLHLGKLSLEHNHISEADIGINLSGAIAGRTTVDLSNNLIANCTTGVRTGLSHLRINHNDIDAETGRDDIGNGIELTEGLDPAAIQDIQIVGNRIRNQVGHGISVQGSVANLIVKQNQLRDINGAGFFIEESGSVSYLSLENNQFRRIRGFISQLDNQLAAVYLQAAQTAEIANNMLEDVVNSDANASVLAGISVTSSANVSITGNSLRGVTPVAYQGTGVGIVVSSNIGHYRVQNNSISRIGDPEQRVEMANWIPLVIINRLVATGGEDVSVIDRNFGRVFRASNLATGAVYNTAPVVVSDNTAFVLLPNRLVNIGARAAADHSTQIATNQLDGSSSGLPAVLVRVGQLCGFDDNDVWSDQAGLLVSIQGAQARANSNRLRAPSDLDSMLINSNRFVVVGNMSNGNIRVLINGQVSPLPEPWQALNIIA